MSFSCICLASCAARSIDMLRLRFFLVSDTVDRAGLDRPDGVLLDEALSDIHVNGEFETLTMMHYLWLCGFGDEEYEVGGDNKIDFTIFGSVSRKK